MKGSIHKHIARDGTVSYRVRVDTIDPVSGRRHQPQRTFQGKREAEAGLARWLVEIEQGAHVARDAQTIARYMDHWLSTMRHRVRASTHRSYAYLTEAYIVPRLGHVPLQKLTPQRLQAFYNTCLSPGGGRSGQPLGARTVRYLHAVLHAALKDALKLGLVARNVAEATTPPRAPQQEARAWSPEEARRFLTVARDDDYWPLWLLALHTGMRRGEILALQWRDVDLDGASVRVRQGKGGGRVVALDAATVAALRRHRATQATRRLWLGPLWEDHDLVFTSMAHPGQAVGAGAVGRHFRALVAQAGNSALTFHGLRHTHATILMLAGVHPKVVSERLGHKSIQMTLQIYSHVLPRMQTEAAEVFAAALDTTSSCVTQPAASNRASGLTLAARATRTSVSASGTLLRRTIPSNPDSDRPARFASAR